MDSTAGARETNEPFNDPRKIEEIRYKASLLANHSGWERTEHPEKEHMAFDVVSNDVPWLLEEIRRLEYVEKRHMDRIRELGHKREEAVKALEWALDEIGETDLTYAEDRKGEWACRVLATLKGQDR